MTPGGTQTNTDKLDPELVAEIVTQVMARLKSQAGAAGADACGGNDQPEPSLTDRLITAETIARVSGSPSALRLPPRAVVTPAARDEAQRRGIRLQIQQDRQASQATPTARENSSAATPPTIMDHQHPERAQAVLAQLAKRGVQPGNTPILLSQTPALDVHHLCSTQAQRAVMIGSLADVERFAVELDPTVWVIDMARVNLVAAVNIIARIAHQAR
ncbi:MAG: hypothetical protein MI861_06955 [Pirellulales bacterium]|nr:hypothetical protein [Pirellulales bacterium]